MGSGDEAKAAAVAAAAASLGLRRTVMAAIDGFLVWEYLSTLPAEIQISRARVTLFNLVFGLLRYVTLGQAAMLTYFNYWPGRTFQDCQKVIRCAVYLPTVALALSNCIVTLRIWAIYQRKIWVLVVLGVLLIASLVLQLWGPSDMKARKMPKGLHACLPTPTGANYWIYWLTVIAFDAIVLFLSLVKTIGLWRDAIHTRVTTVLIRDQVFFFGMSFAGNLVNMIYYAALVSSTESRGEDQGDFELLAPLAVAVQSVATCRIVFNLRKAAEEPAALARVPSTLPFWSTAPAKSAAPAAAASGRNKVVEEEEDDKETLKDFAGRTRRTRMELDSLALSSLASASDAGEGAVWNDAQSVESWRV